jgi:hypothetical protein
VAGRVRELVFLEYITFLIIGCFSLGVESPSDPPTFDHFRNPCWEFLRARVRQLLNGPWGIPNLFSENNALAHAARNLSGIQGRFLDSDDQIRRSNIQSTREHHYHPTNLGVKRPQHRTFSRNPKSTRCQTSGVYRRNFVKNDNRALCLLKLSGGFACPAPKLCHLVFGFRMSSWIASRESWSSPYYYIAIELSIYLVFFYEYYRKWAMYGTFGDQCESIGRIDGWSKNVLQIGREPKNKPFECSFSLSV